MRILVLVFWIRCFAACDVVWDFLIWSWCVLVGVSERLCSCLVVRSSSEVFGGSVIWFWIELL